MNEILANLMSLLPTVSAGATEVINLANVIKTRGRGFVDDGA